MGDNCEIVIRRFEHLFQPLRPFHRDDFSLDTDSASWAASLHRHGGHSLAVAGSGAVSDHPHNRLPPAGPSLSLHHAGTSRSDRHRPDDAGRSDCRWACRPEHGPVNDGLPINRMGNGAAHPDVAQCRIRIVHGENGFPCGANDDLEARVGAELLQQFRRTEIGKTSISPDIRAAAEARHPALS